MTDKFIIEGGHPIEGEVWIQGNKNEALPILCACLLNTTEHRILNLPDIKDIQQLIKILEFLGAEVHFQTKGNLLVSTKKLKSLKVADLPSELVTPLRGSITLIAPLLARYKKVIFPKPGGDKIGRRRIDTHLLALSKLGVDIQIYKDNYVLEVKNFRGANILLDEASVTATENAIMAASVAKGTSVIENAASEPHVQGLCYFLKNQGVPIEGIGSNILTIHGVESYENLRGTTHTMSPDYLEVGSFVSMAALTGGELTIKNVIAKDLRMILFNFDRLGIETSLKETNEGTDLFVKKNQSLKVKSDIHEEIPKIDDAPWPGLPADMTSIMLVTATQCSGTVLIHEKLFESRLFFTDKLISMGAKVVLCDPHRAIIIGPSPLHGANLSSPDIRAGMSLVIAALCAEGQSTINNIMQIDRGYEKIDLRLKKLGANIKRG